MADLLLAYMMTMMMMLMLATSNLGDLDLSGRERNVPTQTCWR